MLIRLPCSFISVIRQLRRNICPSQSRTKDLHHKNHLYKMIQLSNTRTVAGISQTPF
ncbi:hypothetical protein BDW59DRAFT_150881 [Aspergillus cavernicola]|uniref:Uncharacterized protein n=1 Tax=Aspergillus cavernicola TaxID=176166 RepID=A0ABR4HXI1_9EURO